MQRGLNQRLAITPFVLMLAVGLCACTSLRTGKAVSPDKVGGLERGVTTQEQVLRQFGTPTFREVRSDGTSVWRYTYEEVNTADTGTLTRLLCTVGILVSFPACVVNSVSYRNGKTVRDELTLVFGEDLVVESYTYMHEEIPTQGVYDPAVVRTGPGGNQRVTFPTSARMSSESNSELRPN